MKFIIFNPSLRLIPLKKQYFSIEDLKNVGAKKKIPILNETPIKIKCENDTPKQEKVYYVPKSGFMFWF